MAKLKVILYDPNTDLRYHLGYVDVQSKGTTTTFAAQFELSEQKFEVFATQVTQNLNTKTEVYSYEINDSTNKTKKPKKSARKN